MKNEASVPVHLKQMTTIAIVCVATILGCSGKHTEGNKDSSLTRRANVVDSTLQSGIAQTIKQPSYEEHQGGFLFKRYCAVCHGREGQGDGFNAFNLDPKPRDLSDSIYMRALSDEQIVQTIWGGGRSVNKSPLMPAYGSTLNREQIRNLFLYVRTFANQDR
jgi:mono/diheme cytochrome c family protein